MRVEVAVRASSCWGAWSQGFVETDLGADLRVRSGAELPRPDRYPAGNWRRMSRLARLCALATEPIISVIAPTEIGSLSLFFGSMAGEYSTGVAFLHTLFQKGPAGASPLLFQNAVHNAPSAHFTIALGATGPVETVAAGLDTAFSTLERAMLAVNLRGTPALVVIAEECGPEIQKGLVFANMKGVFTEGAAAFLLEPGRGLWLDDQLKGPLNMDEFGAGPASDAARVDAAVRALSGVSGSRFRVCAG